MESITRLTRVRRTPIPTARIAPRCRKTCLLPLDSLSQSALFRREMGDLFVNHYLALKRKEADRFAEFATANSLDPSSDEITEWEQNEYFDFF